MFADHTFQQSAMIELSRMIYLAQTPPEEMTDILVIPIICFVLAWAIWYFGISREAATDNTKVKWLSIIPIGAGLIYGVPLAMRLSDYAYLRLLPNRKLIYSHYLAAGLPLLALIIILIWLYLAEKRKKQWHLH